MDMPNLQMNVQKDYYLYLSKFMNIDFDVQYNIYFMYQNYRTCRLS